jgi:hypothetical protein
MRSLTSFVTVSLLTLGIGACTASSDGDDGWDFADGKSDGAGAISYGALAAAKVPPSFDKVVTGLAVIDGNVMPPEPKAVRKQIAEVRDYIDLFAYAYTTKHGDPWADIRDDLDTGYETIGAFKDLFDRQGIADPAMAVYDPAELAARRAEVIAWTTPFLAVASDDRAYLAAPSQTKLYVRDHDHLSQFFWGATKLEPSTSRSGLKNMAKLTRELLSLASGDYGNVLDLRDIHKPANQVKFHDFRKRIRSIARMPGYFPAIVETDADITAEMAVIADAVDRYGTLNDLITRYAHDPSGDLKDQIASDWKDLRDWQKQNDFGTVLDTVHDAIRK